MINYTISIPQSAPSLITPSQCNELIQKSEFLFQNTEMLISLSFIMLLTGIWLITYCYADKLTEKYSQHKIQNFLLSIQYSIFAFCAAMIIYILYFK